MTDKPVLRLAEVAELLGCSISTVRNLVTAGELQVISVGLGVTRAGSPRVTTQAFDAFLKRRMAASRRHRPLASARGRG